MLRNDFFSVCFVTVYLFIYIGPPQFEPAITYCIIMLLFSPILICWMVFTVLKYGKYEGPELGYEEFGYQDKSKDELGIF
jgi:hypothetical protein